MTSPVDARKADVNRFFQRTPSPPSYASEYTLMIIGGAAVGLTIFGLVVGAARGGEAFATTFCCGFLFLVGGAIAGVTGLVKYTGKRSKYRREYALAQPKPPVAWIRELLYLDLHRIEQRAMESLGLQPDDLAIEPEEDKRLRELAIQAGQRPANDTTKRPVLLVGPAKPTRVALDADGRLLFERCSVTVICPTATQFSIYDCTLYLDTGGLGREETLQYPYSHVAAVSTVTEPVGLPLPYQSAPGPNAPAGPNQQPNPLEANYDAKFTDFEYQLLKIQVSSGNSAVMSCGLVNQRDRSLLMSSFQLDFRAVTEEVRKALRRRGALMPQDRQPLS